MEITPTFRATLIFGNIILGAINTICTADYIQPTNFKTSKWSTKDSITSSSSTPSCKYLPIYPDHLYVHRIGTRPCHILHHEKKRSRNIQIKRTRCKVSGQINKTQPI